MTVLFLIFWIRSVKNGSNLIKLFGQKWLFGSNGFSAETAFLPKNTFVKFEVAFWPQMFVWLEMANLIKLDQIGFPHRSKIVTIKSCHIYRKDKNGCFIFDFFGSDLSKMEQTWSNLIKLDFLIYKKLWHLQNG